MKISGRHLLVLVAMCGLLASAVGLVTNVSGLFFSPIADEFGVARGAASMMLTISNLSFAVGGLLCPRLMTERTLKPLVIGATAILAASTAALSVCPGIMPMYVLCVLRGMAAGAIGFVFATSVLNRWFVANIGLATSIAMGCSGIAGAVFSPVINGVISSAGWRTGFVAMAVLTVALNLPAILFLPSLDPATKGLKAFGADDAPQQADAEASAEAPAPAQAEPINPLVYAAVMGFALLASALTALPQHFPGMAESFLQDAAVGASMLSVCMVANTAGKVVLGILVDKFGTRVSLLLYSGLVAIALVLLLFVPAPWTMLVAAGLFGTSYGMAAVGNTMITRDAFGLANYGKTYPVMSLVGNVGNAVFSSAVGYMYDFTGGYAATLVLFGVMTVVLAGLVVFVYARKQAAPAA